MPRTGRLLIPECPHHIIQRGHNKNVVFLADQDYQYYLDNLKEWKQELKIEIYAWCLMTNHIHIIARPPKQASVISKMMKRVNGRQTMYTNKLESRSGSLWDGRFKASPIQEEQYLINCCRYIELNPVHAGMVRDPQNYRCSYC
jgi:putative transposase